MDIQVYACNCGNYYGASGMGDLSKKYSSARCDNVYAQEQLTGTRYKRNRAQCPNCGAQRKLLTFTAPPFEQDPVPPLPQTRSDPKVR